MCVVKLHTRKEDAKKMTDTIALEMAIKKKGLTKKAVAHALNLSECGFLSKLNNKTEFKQSEIDMLCTLLDLPDREIFFAKNE